MDNGKVGLMLPRCRLHLRTKNGNWTDRKKYVTFYPLDLRWHPRHHLLLIPLCCWVGGVDEVSEWDLLGGGGLQQQQQLWVPLEQVVATVAVVIQQQQ